MTKVSSISKCGLRKWAVFFNHGRNGEETAKAFCNTREHRGNGERFTSLRFLCTLVSGNLFRGLLLCVLCGLNTRIGMEFHKKAAPLLKRPFVCLITE